MNKSRRVKTVEELRKERQEYLGKQQEQIKIAQEREKKLKKSEGGIDKYLEKIRLMPEDEKKKLPESIRSYLSIYSEYQEKISDWQLKLKTAQVNKITEIWEKYNADPKKNELPEDFRKLF
jgi:predicted nuclease with TOPRIM domain